MTTLTPGGSGEHDHSGDLNSRALTAVARQNTPSQNRSRGPSATPNPSRLDSALGSMRGSPTRSPNRRKIGSPGYDAGSSRGAHRYAGLRSEDEKRLEFEKYRAEARTRATAGKYVQAIEMYSKALQLKGDHAECLVARATCYHELSEYAKALKDTEAALKVTPNHAKANHIKGEAHYQKGEFEYALVCFHRAKKLRPGVVEYDRDIKKAEGAIEASIGAIMKNLKRPEAAERSSGAKLNMQGDLQYFENQKALGDRSIELLVRQTSAQRREALARQDHRGVDRSGGRDAKTIKQLLEEMYGDWKYLDDLLRDEDTIMDELDEEEKEEEIKRKRLIKEKRDALKGGNPLKQVEEDDDKLVPKDSFSEGTRKKRRQFCQSLRLFSDNELTYLSERAEFWMQQKPPANKNKKPTKEAEAKEILRTLESIEDDLSAGDQDESLKRARKLLREIEASKTLRAGRKQELLSTTYSLIGCSYFEQELYDKAIEHHQKDLKLSGGSKAKDAKSRALDNLGRTYAKKGDYKNAIIIFEQKISMVTSDLESTWLYHELGRCYLETSSYSEAQSCAVKSVASANQTDDRAWQLNASVLLAQTEVELKNYSAAIDAFEKALTIARIDDDDEAKAVITKAISDVNKKIGNEEDSRPGSSASDKEGHRSRSPTRSGTRSRSRSRSRSKSPKDQKRTPSPKGKPKDDDKDKDKRERSESPKDRKRTPSPKGKAKGHDKEKEKRERSKSPEDQKRSPSPKGKAKGNEKDKKENSKSSSDRKRSPSPKGKAKGNEKDKDKKEQKSSPSPQTNHKDKKEESKSTKDQKRSSSPKGKDSDRDKDKKESSKSSKDRKRSPSPKGKAKGQNKEEKAKKENSKSSKDRKRSPSPKGKAKREEQENGRIDDVINYAEDSISMTTKDTTDTKSTTVSMTTKDTTDTKSTSISMTTKDTADTRSTTSHFRTRDD